MWIIADINWVESDEGFTRFFIRYRWVPANVE